MGPMNLEYVSFLSGLPVVGKSIQKSWQFIVDIVHIGASDPREIGRMPTIKEWHVVDVTLPTTYNIDVQTQKYGPITRSFPTMKSEGLHDIQVTFEEDDLGTIASFILWCQRKIVTQDGFHRAPAQAKIDAMIITALDDIGVPIAIYTLKNFYFKDADKVKYSYQSNDPVRYTITFAADTIGVILPKSVASLVPSL